MRSSPASSYRVFKTCFLIFYKSLHNVPILKKISSRMLTTGDKELLSNQKKFCQKYGCAGRRRDLNQASPPVGQNHGRKKRRRAG